MSRRDQENAAIVVFKRHLNEHEDILIPVRIVQPSLAQRTSIIQAAHDAVAEARLVLNSHLKID